VGSPATQLVCGADDVLIERARIVASGRVAVASVVEHEDPVPVARENVASSSSSQISCGTSLAITIPMDPPPRMAPNSLAPSPAAKVIPFAPGGLP
jgi:hypothetical protein